MRNLQIAHLFTKENKAAYARSKHNYQAVVEMPIPGLPKTDTAHQGLELRQSTFATKSQSTLGVLPNFQ